MTTRHVIHVPDGHRARVGFGSRFSRSGGAWSWLRERVKAALVAAAAVIHVWP